MVATAQKEGVRLFVYALCEPDGKTIRYVGLTANLYKRFKGHYLHSCTPSVRAWINSLRQAGLMPCMIVLREVVGLECGVASEKEEIQKHKSRLGSQLLNEQCTGKRERQYRRGRVSFGGKSMTLSEWARELGISRQALNIRLNSHPIEVALSRGKDPGEPLAAKRLSPAFDPGTETIAVDLDVIARTGLSHPERRQRRKLMAADLLSGMNKEQVAVKYGVTVATVENAREEFCGRNRLTRNKLQSVGA